MKRTIITLIATLFLFLATACHSSGCGCPGGAGYPKHNTAENMSPMNNNRL